MEWNPYNPFVSDKSAQEIDIPQNSHPNQVQLASFNFSNPSKNSTISGSSSPSPSNRKIEAPHSGGLNLPTLTSNYEKYKAKLAIGKISGIAIPDPLLGKSRYSLDGGFPAKLALHQPSPHQPDANPCSNFKNRAPIETNSEKSTITGFDPLLAKIVNSPAGVHQTNLDALNLPPHHAEAIPAIYFKNGFPIEANSKNLSVDPLLPKREEMGPIDASTLVIAAQITSSDGCDAAFSLDSVMGASPNSARDLLEEREKAAAAVAKAAGKHPAPTPSSLAPPTTQSQVNSQPRTNPQSPPPPVSTAPTASVPVKSYVEVVSANNFRSPTVLNSINKYLDIPEAGRQKKSDTSLIPCQNGVLGL